LRAFGAYPKSRDQETTMDKVSFPYRASSHLVLLHVIAESGAWEKHGVEVNYNFQISASDAHRKIPAHEVEFVGGNHVSTYAARAHGDNWVYLGQTVNHVHNALVTRQDSGINAVTDIRGKKVATSGAHPGLNDWLFLKQNGLDVDRDDYELIRTVAYKKDAMDPVEKFGGAAKKVPLYQWVADKRADACFLTPPATLFAKEAGLKVIDLEPFPMIWFTTVSSSLTFVEKHPDLVQRFLKGIIEGIHFFKTRREESIKIIEDQYTREGKLDRAKATIAYDALLPLLSTKLFPSMNAISNVYQEAVYKDKDSLKVNPMELWDFHHVRQIADSGFIDNLYKGSNT
jgi:ABC-type nitrate/sulfonate/bicarbonate transport system substrate-binding protein